MASWPHGRAGAQVGQCGEKRLKSRSPHWIAHRPRDPLRSAADVTLTPGGSAILPAVERHVHHHYGPEFLIYGTERQDAAALLIRKALGGHAADVITNGWG
jgi:hypothetical protein